MVGEEEAFLLHDRVHVNGKEKPLPREVFLYRLEHLLIAQGKRTAPLNGMSVEILQSQDMLRIDSVPAHQPTQRLLEVNREDLAVLARSMRAGQHPSVPHED